MSLYGVYNVTEHAHNMSRVDLGDQDLVCTGNENGSGAGNSTCSIPAGLGISLSTPILMMTIGVVGNVLALLVLYSSRREAQARRTVFFVMLAGLAWTDLIGQLSVSPIAIVTYANNLKWVGGTPLCRYHGFMMVSFGLVIPLIVSCMSCERFIAIRFSYFYARHITRRKAQLTFLACWTVTALFTALPFVGFGSYERQYPGSWCFLNFHRESILDAVYAAMFSFMNIIAICVMIVCNVIVALTLLRMRYSRHLNSSPSLDRKLSVSGVVGFTTTPGTVIRGKRHSDMEAQMIWFLCLITIAFSVCWMPLNIHILLTQFTGETNKTLDLIVIRMASCNQILDPWLYVIFRKNSMLRIIRRIKACFVKKKEPPRNGTIRGPSVRYVIGNKSFTIEATTVGKTVMPGQGGGGNQSPLYNFQDLNDLSDYSEESTYRLMCVSPNSLDNSHRRRSDQRPLINLRLGHSPTEKRKHGATPPSTPPSSPDKLVSLPFIERPKVKHVAEISECTLPGSYESAGSTHYTPYVRPSMKPGTPTNDLTEQQDSSSTADNRSCESQRHPPKSLIITDSNYVLISAPLPTPERERTPLLLKPNNQTLHAQPVVTSLDIPLPPPHQNCQLPGDTGGVTGTHGMVQQKNGVISRQPFVHQTNDPFQVQTNLHTQFPCDKTNNHFDYCTCQTTCQVESDKDVTLLQPHFAQTSPITNGLDESRPTLTICHRHLNGFTNSFTQDAILHRSPAKDLILIEPCQAKLYNVNNVGDILLCSEYTNISNKCSDSELSLFNGQKHSLENDGKFKSWNSFY